MYAADASSKLCFLFWSETNLSFTETLQVCQIPLHPNFRVPEKVVSVGGLLGPGPGHYLGQGYGCCIVQWSLGCDSDCSLSVYLHRSHSLTHLPIVFIDWATSASKTQIYFRLLSRKGTKSRPWRLGIQCFGDTFCSVCIVHKKMWCISSEVIQRLQKPRVADEWCALQGKYLVALLE